MGEFLVSPILLLTADRSAMFTTTVVVAGMSIVFAVLIILIIIFNLYGKIVSKLEGSSKAHRNSKTEAKEENLTFSVPAASVVPSAPAPVVEQGISAEVVAAITAAIVASEGPGVVVRSVKRVNVGSRNPWAAAAVADNTRPF